VSTLGTKTKPYIKDPNAVLDYVVNWATFLDVDTIASDSWIVPSGITSVLETNTTTTSTIWLSGGTLNSKYRLTNRVVTAGGRTDDRSIYVLVKDK
jgi:hypothetical protein